ncbi:interleukin-6 receptor subunit beta-like [Zootoca vivipara]|uniref:interleukin-6 receptor subunit beta-like n=1 Tax=Zootoca vivipara TaxID=8524 RepID=UPI001590E04B|nr:interleukin-6 receptor subunit beta-like [Zootoca vivipara]
MPRITEFVKPKPNRLPVCGFLCFVSLYFSGEAPRSLKLEYCVSFWAKNITCYWNPLPDMGPATTYRLHITEEAGRCQMDFGYTRSCTATQGDSACGVPVENLFAFYKINLTAESRGVQVSSPEMCIHGMSIVKLSAPEVSIAEANRSRCFYLEWNIPGDEVLSMLETEYEIQFRNVAETSWMQVNFTLSENAPGFANICHVSPFTNYSVQVRAKYLHEVSFAISGGRPFWSDWSRERFVRTLPEVPSAGPALWRKLGHPDGYGNRVVVLMWKPLTPKEANGEILGYSLHSQKREEPAALQCFTPDLQCSLLLPAGEEFTFLVVATNMVGMSPPTKLVVPPSGSQEALPSLPPVLVSPAGDHSLLLRWPLPSNPMTVYIFEWGQLPAKEGRDMSWCYQPANVGHVFITEAIEPGKLYELKIFALIDGKIWASGSTSAYSKQIAPLRAPTLYPVQVWKSQVELQWEILPLEERGGVIRNYTVFYKKEGEDEHTAVVLDNSIHGYLIEGLVPSSVVTVFITVANDAGSTDGPILSIHTKDSDYGETEILFSVLCVGFLFILLAGFLACLWKYRLLRKYLWPPIPDPAKSNLATWAPQKMCLDFSPCRPEKWHRDYLTLTINDLLRVLPSQSEEMGRKAFFGNQWLVDVPGPLQKSAPIIRNRSPSWGSGGEPQKHMSAWSRVDYARVIVVQKNHGLKDPQRSPRHLRSPCTRQDPENSALRSKSGQGVWLQNFTYEALLDVGPDVGEFPLLVNLVEGILHPTESPQGTPRKKP